MRIRPARSLRGRVRVPGDKSISHRAAIISALAAPGGLSRLTNYSTSADCASTLHCLRALGVRIERDGQSVEVEGAGTQMPHAPRAAALDCGNSGTTMRLLAGLLAGQPFDSTLDGDASLRSRPMKRVIEPLQLMGARIEADEGRAPLRIKGRRMPLAPIRYALPVASAQVKSCLLLAALNADGRSEIIEARGATRDHTERLLTLYGADVRTETTRYEGRDVPLVSIQTPASLRAHGCNIAGDISSAAFFMAAGALLPGSELTLSEVGLNPTRTAILHTLQRLGANVSVMSTRMESGEESGELRVRGSGALTPDGAGANCLRGELIAGLIDELPILSVIGTQVEGGLEIRDASELRVKETDRIGAMVKNLRAMGAEVEEYADGLGISGRTRLKGAQLESFGDHRIAMACAVAALLAEGESQLEGAEAVAVSFPEFFRMLDAVTVR
ncbi:MAG TPA: 3-phosphoshikimate 1-carboxyvinyltransferase [Pyrinomonadaceae bacterium]|nr:3-phosphoshikimate 1-carboxyvinyltransferase [Pyrinomonadaceae bacterium]